MSQATGPDADGTIRVETEIQRKHPSLPRFALIPSESVEAWGLEGTTMVEVSVDGVLLGRRSLKPWPEQSGWFVDLTAAQCERAGVDTGDVVSMEIRLASRELPGELRELLASNAAARATWDALSESRRRMLAEHVRTGKRSETRRRRARSALVRGK